MFRFLQFMMVQVFEFHKCDTISPKYLSKHSKSFNFPTKIARQYSEFLMNHADLIGGIIARIAGIKNIFWGVHQTVLIKGKSKASTIMIVKLNAIL